MKQIVLFLLFTVVVVAWCQPGFAGPARETDNGAGPFTMNSAIGGVGGVDMIGQGGGGTLNVGTAGTQTDVFSANNPLGTWPGLAISTSNSSLSNINFLGSSNVYGDVGTSGLFFANISAGAPSSTVTFLGTVYGTVLNVTGTGTVNFNSGTGTNSTAVNIAGNGTVSLAPNTIVTGALTTNLANTGTLVLGSNSTLNGAVGGATGIKAINVVGGNNSSGISATITGAVDTYSASLLTNTLSIGGALTVASGGVIDTTVASSSLYGNIIPVGAVTIGSGVVIDETLVGSSSIIAAHSIVGNFSGPIPVGVTVASGGTLDLSGGSGATGSLNGASGSNVNLGGNTLTTGSFNTTDDYAGVIAGSGGALTKVGTGILTLSGLNTYTGPTTISAGTLKAATGAGTQAFGLNSAMTVDLGATLDLGGLNETIGSLSGAGTVTNNGANSTLTAGGDNTSTTFSGLIRDGSGTTALTKAGAGILDLSNANTYSGGTIINAGTLQVTNDNALGTGAVTNNAVLAIGTTDLILSNPYIQNAGSSLDLTANSSSNYGKITSLNNAATVVYNSNVNVTVGGYIPNNTILTIINTDGKGIGASPTTVNTIETGESVYSPRVSFTSSILNNNLILTANHSTTGFSSLGGNDNARAAGNVLDNVTNPSRDMTNVLNTLEFLSNAKTTSALNTLSPIVDGGIRDDSMSALDNFIGVSLERLQNTLSQAESSNPANTGVSSGDESKLNGIWAKQYGSYLDQGTRQGVQGYDAWNTGTAVGLDRKVSDDLTLGASVGYSYGQVNSAANNASTDINSAQGTIYAGYQNAEHPYYIDLAGTFAQNWYNGQRDISVDTINRIADSAYDGQQYGTYLEGGYKINLWKDLDLTPLASLQWTHLSIGGYDESNADSLDLIVNRQNYNILESAIGASLANPVHYNWGNFTPEVHAKWLYDFIGDDMVVTSAYSGGGGSFTTHGANPAKNGVNLGGKLSFDFKNDISLIAGVDTEMKDNFFGVSGTVTVSYKF